MNELSTREQAVYLYALGSLPGVGPKSVLAIIRTFPQLSIIPEISPEELAKKSGIPFTEKIHRGLTLQWKNAFSSAERIIDHHFEKGVFPLPITSNTYPPLLKLIKDPPAILYIKGDLAVLHKTRAIAVVGTREPTLRGFDTAKQIAYQCAKSDYVIVSGLAKGTDTAAHTGAIEAGGKTIAVFAMPLDKVYPSENKQLSDQISNGFGVLVSEYPFGMFTSKGAFVERDRIQSGLSLAVIPVQTGIKGGTMHTVGFARNQKRLLICPVPSNEEMDLPQNEGIWSLLREKTDEKARPLKLEKPDIYERLFALLEKQEERLLTQMNDRNIPLQQQKLLQQREETAQIPISIAQNVVPTAHLDADVLTLGAGAGLFSEQAIIETVLPVIVAESIAEDKTLDEQTRDTTQSLPSKCIEQVTATEPMVGTEVQQVLLIEVPEVFSEPVVKTTTPKRTKRATPKNIRETTWIPEVNAVAKKEQKRTRVTKKPKRVSPLTPNSSK